MSEQLASNNPFRDRASASVQSVERPLAQSRNPFLDSTSAKPRSVRVELRDEHLAEREKSQSRRPPSSSRDESHRPRKTEHSSSKTSSQTELLRGSTRPSNTSTRPRRPRSISDTSAVDLKKEKQTQERRREKSSREGSGTTGKPRKNLDKIDLLDVTGFASAGGFHHDGPFDACNPHRNKNAKKAPVLAFAKDSTAMTMAAGPPTQPVYFGDHMNNAESFADYGSSGNVRPNGAVRTASFDPTSKFEPIHGHESVGLGTTTFLEGAPASRSAMLTRTNSANGSRNELRPRATSDYASGGLGRKKSVLQKIRGAYKERTLEAVEYSPSPPSSPYKHKVTNDYFEKETLDTKPGTSNITFQLTDDGPSKNEPSTQPANNMLSPLYRPASQGVQTNDHSSSSGTNNLIKRVKSLRVGKKREESSSS